MSNLLPFGGLIIFGIVCALFILSLILAAVFIGPKSRNPTKDLPWECGAVSVGNVQDSRFNVRFYLVAVLFILFDVEVVLLYPWAVQVREFGLLGLLAVISFLMVLSIGLIYVWRRGVLNWNE